MKSPVHLIVPLYNLYLCYIFSACVRCLTFLIKDNLKENNFYSLCDSLLFNEMKTLCSGSQELNTSLGGGGGEVFSVF